jgi:hypothetical protein
MEGPGLDPSTVGVGSGEGRKERRKGLGAGCQDI